MPRGAADTDDVMLIPSAPGVGEGEAPLPLLARPPRYYWSKIVSNARRRRTVKTTPRLDFTYEQFEAWMRRNPPVCHYCGTHDVEVQYLGHIDQNGNHVKTIGVDRTKGPDYAIDNICWSCIICNRTKGADSYTYQEMLDPALRQARSNLHLRRAAMAHRKLIDDYWDIASDHATLRGELGL
jgi:hypothetical protein